MKGEESIGVGTPKLEYVEKGIKMGEKKKGGEGGRKVRKKRKRKKKKKKKKEKEKEREKEKPRRRRQHGQRERHPRGVRRGNGGWGGREREGRRGRWGNIFDLAPNDG